MRRLRVVIVSERLSMERGERVGEYVLEGMAGRGAFAEVWRARHAVLSDRVVAVKVATDAAFAEYLRREGLAQHSLEHPRIVTVFGGDVACERPYLVMEYMEGGSLRRRLKERGRLSEREALEVIRDVSEALRFAHGKGVVHCDLKPGNVLLDGDGGAKLGDFGLWRFKCEAARTGELSLSLVSVADVVGGTLEYASPEVRRGAEPEPCDDVYSLGVMLFETVTGRLPSPGDEVSDFVTVGYGVEEAFARTYVRREKRLSDVASFVRLLGVRRPREAARVRGAPFVEKDEEPERSPDEAAAVATALAFLRRQGVRLGEEDCVTHTRSGDGVTLVFRDALGMVEYRYTLRVKDGEVEEFSQRRVRH